MSELHENKNLANESSELLNANKPGETGTDCFVPYHDILFYITSDYAALPDEDSKRIKQTYEFIKLVYGKSNTERLSKIIDKVVKKDMESFEGKTDEEITNWQRQKNPDYSFENSLYAQMKEIGDSKLVESMILYMILLDILTLKCYDLNLNDQLEK